MPYRYSRSRDVDRYIVFISDLWYKNKPQIVTDDAVFYGLLDGRDPADTFFIRVTKGAAL
jgi:hypothetical protein